MTYGDTISTIESVGINVPNVTDATGQILQSVGINIPGQLNAADQKAQALTIPIWVYLGIGALALILVLKRKS
jgi:hypothetical protein